MKEIKDVTTYLPTSEVSKQLGIEASTLRKYAQLIDKMAEDGAYFERDKRNHRLYTTENLKLIKKVIKLKNEPPNTLVTAIEQALGIERYSGKSHTEIATHSTRNDDAKAIYQLLAEQSKQINDLTTAVKTLTDSNVNISNQLQDVLNDKEQLQIELETPAITSDKKKGFFARLFNK